MAQIEFNAEAIGAALRQASAQVQQEVGALIQPTALRVKTRVQGAFPIGPTGNLHDRVSVSQPRLFMTTATGQNIPTWQVKATSPHVFIWEEGTKERFDATRKGARRGRSPRHGKVFEAISAQERQQMLRQAQAILDRPAEI
jgi:hypothetical protein